MFEEMKDKNAATADFLRLCELHEVDAQQIASQIETFQRSFKHIYEMKKTELLEDEKRRPAHFEATLYHTFDLVLDRAMSYERSRSPSDLGDCLGAFFVGIEYVITSRLFDAKYTSFVLGRVQEMVNRLKQVNLKFKREAIRIENIERKLGRSLSTQQRQLIEQILAELVS